VLPGFPGRRAFSEEREEALDESEACVSLFCLPWKFTGKISMYRV